MLGYWRQPDKTAEVIDAARWMHTGDLAVMDDDGYLSITGRIKDMVIRGGENIYPREVEEFLYTHPDILDAQVIGVPDAKYGEELMAWIRLRPGAQPLTAEAVREFCHGKLAHYKIPRYVHLTDEFPMTVTGKIRKVEMREKSTEIPRPLAHCQRRPVCDSTGSAFPAVTLRRGRILYRGAHVRNEASPYRRRRPDGRAALRRDRRRPHLDRLGQPATEGRHAATSDEAPSRQAEPDPLQPQRLRHQRQVHPRRNTGNTFQQTYQDSTVLGVPIAGPYVGVTFPTEDYVALPIGNHELYVTWLDPSTDAIVDVFVMNFKHPHRLRLRPWQRHPGERRHDHGRHPRREPDPVATRLKFNRADGTQRRGRACGRPSPPLPPPFIPNGPGRLSTADCLRRAART